MTVRRALIYLYRMSDSEGRPALLLVVLVAPTLSSDTNVLVRTGAGLMIAASLYASTSSM